MSTRRTPDEDDISPIRASLPEGPAPPVAPIAIQWLLLTAGGFAMRLRPEVTEARGVVQIGGIIAALIAAGIALKLLASKSVIARFTGGLGVFIATVEFAYLVWLLGNRSA